MALCKAPTHTHTPPRGFLHRWSTPAPTCWLSFQETWILSSCHHPVEWLLSVFQHKAENDSYGDQRPNFRQTHATCLGGGDRDPPWLLQGTLKHPQSYPDIGVSIHTMEKQSWEDQNSLTPCSLWRVKKNYKCSRGKPEGSATLLIFSILNTLIRFALSYA